MNVEHCPSILINCELLLDVTSLSIMLRYHNVSGSNLGMLGTSYLAVLFLWFPQLWISPNRV